MYNEEEMMHEEDDDDIFSQNKNDGDIKETSLEYNDNYFYHEAG